MSVNIVLPFAPVSGVSEDLTLKPDQINLIRNVAAGRDTSFSRMQAINLLPSANFPNKATELQRLLENEQESQEIRHLAALALYKVNTPEAVEILLKNSQTQDQRVLASVMKGLGRIGNERTLAAISSVRARATGLAASQAEFAAALISHRLGLAGNDLKIPNSSEYLQIPGKAARLMQVAKASDAEAGVCLQSLATQPFGIEYAENSLYQIQCGRNNWMLVFNREFTHQESVQTWQTHKAFPGVIATKNEETGSYSTAFLLLTSPAAQPNLLNILIHRATGEQIFSGTGQVEGSKTEFSIRSIPRPGAFPVNIEGTFEGGQVELKTALSGTAVQERRRPTRTSQLPR